MKFEQKQVAFQPVVITLETQAEVDTLRNIIGGMSYNVCNQLGGYDTTPLFEMLDNIAQVKCDDVLVTITE